MHERLGVAGSGAIACGLAATAARHGEVLLWARSSASAQRARGTVEKVCGRLSGEVNAGHVKIVEDLADLGECSLVVEAIAEDMEAKTALFAELDRVMAPDALLASTTSSLSVEALAAACGRPERFFGLHVFNPVPQMKLVELVFPEAASEDVRSASSSARPPSSSRTRRASWSTACSSRTCSAPWTSWRRPASSPRRSTPR